MTKVQTNIYKRVSSKGKKESWTVRWKDTETGNWKARTAGRTKDEALLVEAQVRQDLALGREPFPEPLEAIELLTMSQLIELFYQSPKFLTAKPLWQVDTKRRINKDILPQLGNKLFSKILKNDFIRFYLYLKNRKLSHATIQKYHALLSAIGDIYSEQTRSDNPVRAMRDFKKYFPNQPSSRDINFLTPEELEQLFAAARVSKCRMILPFIQFLAHTGLRRSEAMDLKWTDIDDSGGFIHVRQSKNGKSRMVPLEKPALEAIRFMSRSHLHVFSKPEGGQYNRRYLLKPLKRAAKVAKLNKRIDLHTLRHSYGSNKIRQGWGLKKVSMILGHSDITITSKVYTHLLDGDLKVRDDFTFDFNTSSTQDGKLKESEMSAILAETISKLILTSEDSLRESLEKAIAELRSSLTSANEEKDSTPTSESGLRATPVLHEIESALVDKNSQLTDQNKTPNKIRGLFSNQTNKKWRPHGDSNPGRRRERAVS
jgi:integrase